MSDRTGHLVYLLRCWQEAADAAPTWRFSLEGVSSEERYGFTSPEALVDFLCRRLEEDGDREAEAGHVPSLGRGVGEAGEKPRRKVSGKP